MEFSRPECWSGYRSLLQGIFPTQGSNPGLLHCRWILYQLSPGKPLLHHEEQRIRWMLETDFLCPRLIPVTPLDMPARWFPRKKQCSSQEPVVNLPPYRAELRGEQQHGFADYATVLGSAFCLRSRRDPNCFFWKSERRRKKGGMPISIQV
ncbi:unnamed protein product [Rangifer tarandus platyrhynchus]|uniref:Uncharacterized protein n=2 Tax=Rangifer tarandus platyrhynchus TaxID=3082113 RepID=A0ABN8YU33_RANTA|nr:unnamed protein product [Rangifer tarandus platyrhynchus]